MTRLKRLLQNVKSKPLIFKKTIKEIININTHFDQDKNPMIFQTKSEKAEATGDQKMKLSLRICNNSMKETYGVAIVPATAPGSEKARPRVAGRGMGRGAEPPKKRCENDAR